MGLEEWDGAVQRLLDRARSGDGQARKELLEWTYGWIEPRVQKRLRRDFPRVADLGQQETRDVLGAVSIKLAGYLGDPAKVPATSRDFYAIARTILDHTLIDLARKYGKRSPEALDPASPQLARASGFASWLDRSQVHELLDRLPELDREVLRIAIEFAHDPPAKVQRICDLLGVKDRGTAYRRLREAFERFAKHYKDDEGRAEGRDDDPAPGPPAPPG